MARKLAYVLALIGLCLATAVYALGVGTIQSDSSLNEPLSARVPLLGVEEDEASGISVGLASPEAFERAGVDRPFSLSRLNFEVKQGPEGPYVAVTTKEAVKEPFLDFLLEVRWPQGKLVREYTLLLDPPTYAPGDDAPATQAPAVAAGDGRATTEQQPAQPGGAATGARASGAAELGTVSEVSEPSVGQYRVRANDTLWEISQQVRPDGSVTLSQTMLALLRENPDAFIDNNMNKLKRGAVLRVPERGEIGGIPVAEANVEVRRQIAKWQRNRGVAAAGGDAGVGQQQAAAPAGQDGEEGGGELRVVAPEEGTGEAPATSAQGEGGENLERQVTLLKESNASLESENEDLKAQVEALKREVVQLESKVNVETGRVLPGDAQQGQQAPTAEQPAEAQQAAGEEAAADTAQAEQQTETEQQAEAGAEPKQPAQPQDATQPDAPAEQQPETAKTEQPAEEQPPEQTAQPQPERAQKPEPPVRPTPPFWQDPMIMGLAGAVLLVLLLLIYMVMRRRGGGDGEAQDLSDQIAAGLEQDQDSDDFGNVFDGESEESAGKTDETFAGLEEEPPELPPESDPLGEAEVYLAYGRYDQAQDVLERALQREPDNKELRLKMLEVLALTQDRGAFENHAQQLHSRVGQDDPVWVRTREMGREIAPEHPLFAGTAPAGAGSADDGEMTFDLPDEDDSAGAGADGGEEPDKAAAASEDFADFDFSFEDDERNAPESAAGESGEGEFDLDFDVSESEEPPPTASDGAGESEEPAAGLDDLEFDLGESSPENPAAKPASDDLSVDHGDEEDLSLDFDLDEDQPMASPTRDESEATAPAGEEGQGTESEDFEFDFEDYAEAESPTEDSEAATRDVDMQSTALDYDMEQSSGSAEPLGAGGDDVDTLDEVSTKLDLARAYLDMGDNEGARALLDEVVGEGNDAQVKEARELLSQAG